MSNNRQFIFFVLLITTIELSVTISIPAQTGQQEPHAFLKKYLGFTQAELDAMDRGQIVVKLPKTGDSHELATFGVVWLNISELSAKRVVLQKISWDTKILNVTSIQAVTLKRSVTNLTCP